VAFGVDQVDAQGGLAVALRVQAADGAATETTRRDQRRAQFLAVDARQREAEWGMGMAVS
jgi:hypothetical protein